MACAANYAWVNRSSMTFLVRQAFAKQFNAAPDDLDMHVIYDVSHNIAKVVAHPPPHPGPPPPCRGRQFFFLPPPASPTCRTRPTLDRTWRPRASCLRRWRSTS